MMERMRVYTCFDAVGSHNPAQTDLKYYFLLRAWSGRAPLAGKYVDVHREAALRGKPVDLRRELERRLRSSDLLLLILSARTRHSAGWLPWEIRYAAVCRLPIVCAYTCSGDPAVQASWWPDPLRRIASDTALRLMHVPFLPRALAEVFAEMATVRSSSAPGLKGPRVALGAAHCTTLRACRA